MIFPGDGRVLDALHVLAHNDVVPLILISGLGLAIFVPKFCTGPNNGDVIFLKDLGLLQGRVTILGRQLYKELGRPFCHDSIPFFVSLDFFPTQIAWKSLDFL